MEKLDLGQIIAVHIVSCVMMINFVYYLEINTQIYFESLAVSRTE